MIDRQIETAVMKQYQERRQKNAAQEDRRLDEIRRECPQIAALLDRRHQMVLSAAFSLFRSVPRDPEEEMKKYNQQIRELLIESGRPADYLQPIYNCEDCRDTGFTGQDHQTYCACFSKAYTEVLSHSAFSGALRQTFAAFDENVFPDAIDPDTGISQRKLMSRVRDRCQKYVNDLPSPEKHTLILCGESGLGKTYLMNCIFNAAVEKGVNALSISAFDLLEKLKNAYFGNSEIDTGCYYTVPLLLIDDLGTEPLMQNVTVEHIYNLMNTRMSNSLCTVITTNLSLTRIRERYSERLFSRFSDRSTSQVLQLTGRDVRNGMEHKE